MRSPACEHVGATLALSQTYVFMLDGWTDNVNNEFSTTRLMIEDRFGLQK